MISHHRLFDFLSLTNSSFLTADMILLCTKKLYFIRDSHASFHCLFGAPLSHLASFTPTKPHLYFDNYFALSHINIHMFNSNSSLLLTINRKTEYRIRSVTKFLFYILQNSVLRRADNFVELCHPILKSQYEMPVEALQLWKFV
jgi:hypothetical protein